MNNNNNEEKWNNNSIIVFVIIIITGHPHLGEVDKFVVGEVGRALFDEGQVRQVDAQVGDARRVATGGRGCWGFLREVVGDV